MARIVSTSAWHSPSVRPPAISSSSSSFGSGRQRAGEFEPLAVEQAERCPASALALLDQPGLVEDVGAVGRPPRASRRRGPKAAATSRFSNTVSFSKGCGIWNERPMPMRTALPSAAARVTSRPSKSIRAGVGAEVAGDQVEQRRLAGAVRADDAERLAARHGRRSRHPRPSGRRSDFETLSSSRIIRAIPPPTRNGGGGGRRPGARVSAIGSILPAGRDLRRGLVVDDDEIEAAVVLLPPLAADERRLADVLRGEGRQARRRPRRPGRRSVSRSVAAIAAATASASVGSVDALHHVGRHLEQRMDEADRLRPGPPGRRR